MRIPFHLPVAAVVLVLTFQAGSAQAADPAVKCESGKLKVVGKYGACRLKAESKAVSRGASSDTSRCESKFSADWGKAEDRAGRGVCPSEDDEASIESLAVANTARTAKLLAGLRYEDTGLGTVIDHKTGLEWQKSDDADGLTDKDNRWFWTSSSHGGAGTEPDGDAFTVFLAGLNACDSSDGETLTGGYAGRCDWRMPSIAELATIVDCSSGDPCFDESVFGPAPPIDPYYWTSVTFLVQPTSAWFVAFDDGIVDADDKDLPGVVRAVRGGL